MLTIRLQRSGKKNKPEFRIILAEKTSAANKKFAEILGHYNPRTKVFGLKEDRLKYWMSQHVTLSPTVHNLLVTKKIIDALKVKAFTIPAKPVAAAAEASAAPDAPAVAEPETPAGPVAEVPAVKASPDALAEAVKETEPAA